jgi:hypothetical protein
MKRLGPGELRNFRNSEEDVKLNRENWVVRRVKRAAAVQLLGAGPDFNAARKGLL